MSCDNKFWIENINCLFSSAQVVPLNNMSMNQQLNAITRLVLVIFVVALLFNFRYGLHFLVFSLVFLIIIWYIQRKRMNGSHKENFTMATARTSSVAPNAGLNVNYVMGPKSGTIEYYNAPRTKTMVGNAGNTNTSKIFTGPSPYINQTTNEIKFAPYNPSERAATRTVMDGGQPLQQSFIQLAEPLPFCNDAVSVEQSFNHSIDDPTFAFGLNQKLANPTGFECNPRTLVAPIIKPKTHDLEYWRENDLVIHSHINAESAQQDMYLSGYAESTCCGYLGDEAELVPVSNKKQPAIVGGGFYPYGSRLMEQSTGDESGVIENYTGRYIPEGLVGPQQTSLRESGYAYMDKGRRIASPVPTDDIPRISYLQVPGRTRQQSIPATQTTPLTKEEFAYNQKIKELYEQSGSAGINSEQTKAYQGERIYNQNPHRHIVSPVPVDDIPFVHHLNPNDFDEQPINYTMANREVQHQGRQGQGQGRQGREQPYKTAPIRQVEEYNGRIDRSIYGSREDFGIGLQTVQNPKWAAVQPNQSGWVNDECGYNPDQVFVSGLPSNLPAGNCEQSPLMKRYNENLHTQIVTPGVYTRNQVNEPINANIGISFQQQFEPVTCSRDENGLNYLEHDPRIVEPAIHEDVTSVEETATYDTVYDPRFNGYGTSYRSYIDPVTGQPRFMYDDVNAIRMPNYVVRSKIDHLPYADSYGPIQEGSEFGNVHNPHIRALAQDSWLRDSLQFRNDLTERRMRKINAISWQKRKAPKAYSC